MAERLRQRSAKPSTPVRIRFRPLIKRKGFKQCFTALSFCLHPNPLSYISFFRITNAIVGFPTPKILVADNKFGVYNLSGSARQTKRDKFKVGVFFLKR